MMAAAAYYDRLMCSCFTLTLLQSIWILSTNCVDADTSMFITVSYVCIPADMSAVQPYNV